MICEYNKIIQFRGLWALLRTIFKETIAHWPLSRKVNCFHVDFPVNKLTHSRVTDPLIQRALLIDELLALRIVHARLICQ